MVFFVCGRVGTRALSLPKKMEAGMAGTRTLCCVCESACSYLAWVTLRWSTDWLL